MPIIIDAQSADSCHLWIFLRKARILGQRNNPGIAQTNIVCCAKSASFGPRSNLEETLLLGFCKLVADCLPELRELCVVPGCKYAYASFVKREGVAPQFRDAA